MSQRISDHSFQYYQIIGNIDLVMESVKKLLEIFDLMLLIDNYDHFQEHHLSSS